MDQPVSQPKPARWPRFLRLLVRVGAGLALLLLMFRWFEQSQVYHPTREYGVEPGALGRPFEGVTLTATDDVKLNAWFFPAATHSPHAGFVFLVCHGNGGNISHRLGLAEALLRTGAAVLLLDYRGYGESTGRPSEEGTYLDAQAASAWLRARGFAPAGIIALGESLGGAIASELAAREPLGGLILQSTFTSIPDIGSELFPWLPVRTLASIRYNTQARLPRLHLPVLVVHSRNDSLIRFRHAERNFAAANEPKFFSEVQGNHNDPVWEEPAHAEAIGKFLTRLAQSRNQPSR